MVRGIYSPSKRTRNDFELCWCGCCCCTSNMISCIYSPYWWLSFGKIAMVDRFETKRRRSLIKSVHVYRAEYHTIFLRFYKVIFSFIFDSITTFTGYSDRSVGLRLNTHCILQSSPNYFGTLWLCHNEIALCFGSMNAGKCFSEVIFN